ncbi:DNA polymerase I [Erysipelothrix sp. HDW6B]|uniref:DNA polymerase I n=1 Tax=Erysipelothrix sp. HDW6B TaxID=2714929 RepID=UPI0014082F3C|nr:DNA polymerase I [Erysipelothrix sp. HDW6B]QIK86051.1 DNA polymerase I [Erysipelothrix sp. HDW6B]
MEKLLLIDGNSMLFRAYYGTLSRGHMMSSTGVVTNAVYGFSTMLTKAIELTKPDYILVAFDTKDKTFRHEMFGEYKGTRKEVDNELVSQFALVREFIDAYPIPRLEISGYEADDIIGTLSKQYNNVKVEILSSDRDLLQLIDTNVEVLLMKKGITDIKTMNLQNLEAEMNITPSQIVDVKALQGDTSDNIPGVPSVGEKTALKLIQQYGSFENLYAHKDEIKGKMGENVRNYEAQARLSYELAKIDVEVPNSITLDTLRYALPDNTLNAFYRKYDMNSLITEDVEITDTVKENFKMADLEESWLADDVTLMLDYDKKDVLQGITIYNANDVAFAYLTLPEMILDSVFHGLLGREKQLFAVSSKALYRFALEHDIAIQAGIEDILLLAFIINPSVTTFEKLKDEYNAWYLNYEGLEQNFAIIKRMHTLYSELKEKALKDDLIAIYDDIELPLVMVLAECEFLGINVDRSILDDVAEKTKSKIDMLTQLIYDEAGEEFNINSPKQLSEVLFDHLQLPSGKKRSTAVSVLESLEGVHPIIKPILEYRKYAKLYSTYAVGLTKFIGADNRIHTSFNQHATQTGRLSSSDPNLQNISVRDEETRAIRGAFIASPGHKLVSIDYSQIELRVLSYLAHEEKMMDAFKHDVDIHTATANEIFGVSSADGAMRRQAKSVNFGIVYGISGFGLSKQLDISIAEASAFIDKYNEAYPNIQKYMDSVIAKCEVDGFVTTYFGRRRYIPEIFDKNRAVKEFGKRAAMNAPIQGTAADIIKIAMVKAHRALKEANLKSVMILQVHDELVFDVIDEEVDQVISLMTSVMESIVDWPIPLKVSVDIGSNWLGE